MANYVSVTRTNYFAVTDSEKLKDIVSRIKFNDGELNFLDEIDGKWGFGGFGSICGLKPGDEKYCDCKHGNDCGSEDEENYDYENDDSEDDGYDEEEDKWAPDAVYEALQEVVASGEAIIITEIGREKLRYFNAYSIIITRDNIEIEELRVAALSKAREMLNDSKFNTQFDY